MTRFLVAAPVLLSLAAGGYAYAERGWRKTSEAQLATLQSSIAALQVQAERSAKARAIAAAHHQREREALEARNAQLAELLSEDIPDADLDPAIANLLRRVHTEDDPDRNGVR